LIGLDIDGRNRADADYKMLKAKFNLEHLFPEADVHIEITRHGYHVIGYGPCLPFDQECIVRSTLGDDRIRVKLDQYKKTIGSHNYNVLWTEKGGFTTYEVAPV